MKTTKNKKKILHICVLCWGTISCIGINSINSDHDNQNSNNINITLWLALLAHICVDGQICSHMHSLGTSWIMPYAIDIMKWHMNESTIFPPELIWNSYAYATTRMHSLNDIKHRIFHMRIYYYINVDIFILIYYYIQCVQCNSLDLRILE